MPRGGAERRPPRHADPPGTRPDIPRRLRPRKPWAIEHAVRCTVRTLFPLPPSKRVAHDRVETTQLPGGGRLVSVGDDVRDRLEGAGGPDRDEADGARAAGEHCVRVFGGLHHVRFSGAASPDRERTSRSANRDTPSIDGVEVGAGCGADRRRQLNPEASRRWARAAPASYIGRAGFSGRMRRRQTPEVEPLRAGVGE